MKHWTVGMMTSLRTDWATPWRLFEILDIEFQFKLDACATARNRTGAQEYFDPRERDALREDWSRYGTVWLNPPYGRQIGKWVEKAYRESRFGATVVCLLPARTDTSWWHDYCLKGEIRFLRGRLNFDDVPSRVGRCPFPSVIVVFRGSNGGAGGV